MRSKLLIDVIERTAIVHGIADTSDGYHVAVIVSALFEKLGVKRGNYADFAKAVEEVLGEPKVVVDLNALKEML